MTTYRLAFLPSARKEWDRLDATIRDRFARKLRERLAEPRIAAARLHGLPDCYKIKLRSAGFRLVYRVDGDLLRVVVIAVGKREREAAYEAAKGRL